MSLPGFCSVLLRTTLTPLEGDSIECTCAVFGCLINLSLKGEAEKNVIASDELTPMVLQRALRSPVRELQVRACLLISNLASTFLATAGCKATEPPYMTVTDRRHILRAVPVIQTLSTLCVPYMPGRSIEALAALHTLAYAATQTRVSRRETKAWKAAKKVCTAETKACSTSPEFEAAVADVTMEATFTSQLTSLIECVDKILADAEKAAAIDVHEPPPLDLSQPIAELMAARLEAVEIKSRQNAPYSSTTNTILKQNVKLAQAQVEIKQKKSRIDQVKAVNAKLKENVKQEIHANATAQAALQEQLQAERERVDDMVDTYDKSMRETPKPAATVQTPEVAKMQLWKRVEEGEAQREEAISIANEMEQCCQKKVQEASALQRLSTVRLSHQRHAESEDALRMQLATKDAALHMLSVKVAMLEAKLGKPSSWPEDLQEVVNTNHVVGPIAKIDDLFAPAADDMDNYFDEDAQECQECVGSIWARPHSDSHREHINMVVFPNPLTAGGAEAGDMIAVGLENPAGGAEASNDSDSSDWATTYDEADEADEAGGHDWAATDENLSAEETKAKVAPHKPQHKETPRTADRSQHQDAPHTPDRAHHEETEHTPERPQRREAPNWFTAPPPGDGRNQNADAHPVTARWNLFQRRLNLSLL